MRSFVVVVIALASLVAGFVAGRSSLGRMPGIGSSPARPPETILASWDGGTLTKTEFDEAIGLLGPYGKTSLTNDVARREIVVALTRSEILAQLAQEQGIDRSPEYQRRKREELATMFLKARQGGRRVPDPTEEELKEWFAANQGKLVRPATIKVAHIFFSAPKSDVAKRDPKRAEVQRALADIKKRGTSDPAAFFSSAQRLSEDTATKSMGGALPTMTLEDFEKRMGNELSRVVTAMEVGAMAEVVETESGFHIVKVLERVPGLSPKFEEIKDSARTRLSAQKAIKADADDLASVESAVQLKIDDDALKALAQ
jgi:parvulin-like peptidyl-prolyl isomerase